MQHFEVTHWWKTYAVNIDEHNGTIEFVLPSGTHTYKMEDLGGVGIYNKAHVVNHGNQTDNIIQGAAIGGKTGAFVAAFSPSGTSVYSTERAFVVCKKFEGQSIYNLSYKMYPEGHTQFLPLPAHRKFDDFVMSAALASTDAIERWHKAREKDDPIKRALSEERKALYDK